MKNNRLAIITAVVALSLSALGQETTSPKATTTNHDVTSAAVMDMEHFTIHPPTGKGWQIASVDHSKHPHQIAALRNAFMNASVSVDDKELNPPVRDVQVALLSTKKQLQDEIESDNKIVLFEGNSEAHAGGDCLYTRVIFVASDKWRSAYHWPDKLPGNLALHRLVCIYGEKHDRMVTLLFSYPTEESNDPQSEHARDFFASLEFKDALLSQETTTNHHVTAAAIMDMGHFTIHPPTGDGWQIAGLDPTAHPDVKAAFHNDFMKAGVTVRDREQNPPARDVQAALQSTQEQMKKKFESESKIVLFEGNLEAHSGEECLYTRIIFVAGDKFRSDSHWAEPANNVALHSLLCIYGEKHDRAVDLLFVYPTEASNDPQGQHARDFFASLEFKGSPAE